MVPILFSKQIREADAFTIANEPIASLDLMERAAEKFYHAIRPVLQYEKPVYVFCGRGNNGGDGLAVARMLSEENFNVNVFVLQEKDSFSGDCLANLNRFKIQFPDRIHFISLHEHFPAITGKSICIDALFGTGLNKPLKGLTAALVKHINESDSLRIAIDIPSGLFAEEFTDGISIHADYTFTFQVPKLAFFFPENATSVGSFSILDIGLNRNFMETAPSTNFLIEERDVISILKSRNKFDHKGKFGHSFIYAGQEGTIGASLLCSKACVKAGAGLTTLCTEEKIASMVATAVPEVMTRSFKKNELKISLDEKKWTAFAFGSGIGTDENAVARLQNFLKQKKAPAVIDADGLNILSSKKNLLSLLPANTILTPHLKEFERLAGKAENWFERHQKQIEFSRKYKVVVILKGAYTCISLPNGNCFFNPTGNAGLAKGGSGDVLTGIVVALLAQNYSPADAAMLGVYLHGLSAGIAVQTKSEEALMASDVIDFLSDAFLQLHSKKRR